MKIKKHSTENKKMNSIPGTFSPRTFSTRRCSLYKRFISQGNREMCQVNSTLKISSHKAFVILDSRITGRYIFFFLFFLNYHLFRQEHNRLRLFLRWPRHPCHFYWDLLVRRKIWQPKRWHEKNSALSGHQIGCLLYHCNFGHFFGSHKSHWCRRDRTIHRTGNITFVII